MMSDALQDCQFCSLFAKANGDDPIGSVDRTDHWLIVEFPLPWSPQQFSEDLQLQPILQRLRHLRLQGIRVRPILIAPDANTASDYRRILYYRRPSLQFTVYDKQEYRVPAAAQTQLAIALLDQMARPSRFSALAKFVQYRQDTSHIREILVCTHGNVDAACARFGFPIYERLHKHYANADLRVWRCSHFGGHQYAPTLIDLPEGRYWGHLELDRLDRLIYRQGEVAELRSFYRGWAGLAKFEQIAEREAWMQTGWEWLSYPKSGEVIYLGEPRLRQILHWGLRLIPSRRVKAWLERSQQDAAWAVVRLQFTTPRQVKCYEAKVAVSGQVMTAIRSGRPLDRVPINQYRVSDLVCRTIEPS